MLRQLKEKGHRDGVNGGPSNRLEGRDESVATSKLQTTVSTPCDGDHNVTAFIEFLRAAAFDPPGVGFWLWSHAFSTGLIAIPPSLRAPYRTPFRRD